MTLAIAVAIVGLIVFLIYKNFVLSGNLENSEIAVLSLDQARMRSDSLYRSLKSNYDIYREENEELYSKIAEKDVELEKYYDRINRLIQQAERDKTAQDQLEAKLVELSEEVERLRKFVDEQKVEIERLAKENAELRDENQTLTNNLENQLTENDSINKQNAELIDENLTLNEKVALASVLKVTNIATQATKANNKGEDRGVNYAKRAEKLKICFDIVPNEVAPQGPDAFQVRILDPVGVMMIIESQGSGRMVLAKQNKEVYYTMAEEFNYSPNSKTICMAWNVENTANKMISGTYSFEIYNKGYHVGTSTLTLK